MKHMTRKTSACPSVLALFSSLLLLALLALPSPAQKEPFIVHDTKPVIMQGPYISSLSETGATIVWLTDTPCHAKIVYGAKDGALDLEADSAAHGLLPVGTLHAVHLSGLTPGRVYAYKAVSTRVVKMKAYWPEKGLAAESPERSFTTFDRSKPSVSFSAIADTHEDTDRVADLLKAVDWPAADFVVHLGDIVHSLESEDQIFGRWLGPAAKAADGSKLLMFLRGNHETRGAFARRLFDYVPTPEGRFYYVRDHGPLHMIILDTGEDKPDETPVYAGLNKFEAYRDEEFAWLERHIETDKRAAEAPFRIVILHQPNWGWTRDGADKWTALANKGRVDLVLGGHFHRLTKVLPGTQGNDFLALALAQDQIAKVEATRTELRLTVTGKDGSVIESFTVKARR